MNKERIKELLRFCITGGLATAIHYVIYLWLDAYISLEVAYSIGYAVSFLFNFIMTTLFTFRVSFSIRRGVGFIGCHVVNYCLQLLLFEVFLRCGIPTPIIPIFVYAIAVPTNFFLLRFVMSRKKFD